MAAVTEGPVVDGDRQQRLVRRVRLLVLATITYNVVEAVIALRAGAATSSSALLGFGLDSVVEVSSAVAVAWQFSATDADRREAREHLALRLIAISFFALAAVVSVDALRSLFGASTAQPSTVGIVLAAVSLAVMPSLSMAQRRAGRELGSATAVADSKQTLICSYLSGVLLLGLVMNATLGWTWADAVAALVIAAFAVREGREAWAGDSCCTPAAQAFTSNDDSAQCCDDCGVPGAPTDAESLVEDTSTVTTTDADARTAAD